MPNNLGDVDIGIVNNDYIPKADLSFKILFLLSLNILHLLM
ncbi:MAG: hypothetical protein AB8V03_00295 [Francisella endosymbiont of Hyalomma asiaticum]